MAVKIDISKYSDFCFGVKRAISIAERALRKNKKPVFSLGPLIHNRQVVGELSARGLNAAGDLKNFKKGTMVVRSHGITTDTFNEAKRKNINIVDATCPFVVSGQKLAKKLSKEDYTLIIVGDKGHPEVKSLKSFSTNKALVVAGRSEAKKLKLKNVKAGVIAQTTQSHKNFYGVVSELLKKQFSEVRIFNTICRDAYMRQESTRESSRHNDLLIIVGGKNSANTKQLYKICRSMGTQAHHIETGADIKNVWLKGKRAIGIISGASTPRWVVDGVIKRLQGIR